MKHPKVSFTSYITAAILATIFFVQNLQAAPYASCVSVTGGAVTFYLNEAGGNVTVTYEDGSTNSSFDGVSTGLNLPKGPQTFSLGAHTTYNISVFKTGTGVASIVTSNLVSNSRGIDVNKNPTQGSFGNIYGVVSTVATPNLAIRRLNSDMSGIATNGGGVAWVANSSSSPYRIAVDDDGYLTVGDFSSAHSGVWRLDPTLTSNQLILGPIGQTAGQAAGSQGAQFSRPLLVGNLASGGSAVLYTVDAGTIPANSSQLNSILVYSNITLANAPRVTPPDLLGPETCLNLVLNNNYPGITRGPNGYFYASGRRDGPSGGSANLQVYDGNLTLLWNSLYNSGVNDYFAQNGTGLADSAISPDGKYVAGVGFGNNQIVVCSLTNGIPDVSTLYVITNTVLVSAGRGICWDAADNVYVSSSAVGAFQEWSLGFTATTITTGNASGPTGFAVSLPSTSVSVSATNSTLGTNSLGNYIFSQVNTYGNPTSASFVLTRTGDTGSALQVFFQLGGSAPTNSYTASNKSSVTFAAGQTTTNITITAVNDGIARVSTTVTLQLSSAADYSAVSPGLATLGYLNTAPNQLVVSTLLPTMYNALSNTYASFLLTRLGDINATAYTVSSYTYGGTAVAGTDYTIPAPITFNPGDLLQTNYVYPLHNGQLPVDSSANAYVGNLTATINVVSASGYTAGTSNASLTILDSANPTTAVLYSNPLTSATDAGNWTITSANNNMATNTIDNTIVFGYDLQNGDPSDNGAIPLPPSGATTALRVTVNKDNTPGASAGVNLYPKNVSFSGNYAVRFSMNVVEGATASSTTEGPLFGINHSGIATNWWTGSTLLSGWDTAGTNKTWESDGVWYWVCADGGAAQGDFQEFTGLGGSLGGTNTGWTLLSTAARSSFVNAFPTNVFTSSGGPGLPSNNSILNLFTANNWADVEIKQLNNVVYLSIDKSLVFEYTNTTSFKSGTLMLGYDDPFSSVGALDGSVYFSNLRVVSLASPFISQIAVNKVNGTVVINFTTVDGDAIASSFALQSASTVTGPYTDSATATITPLSAGAFQAVVPKSGAMQYYRIHQK